MADLAGNATEKKGDFFSSRLTLLLCALGVAVGTGNIWRFPRIAAQNAGDDGAGAFLLAWVVFLFLWSIPLLVAEYALGRASRMAPVGAFVRMAGTRFAWMGAWVAWVATAIMFYYAVVAGWCIYYFKYTLVNPLPVATEEAMAVWDGFQEGNLPMLFHALAILIGVAACWKGVVTIERVKLVMVPALLFIVLGCVVRAVTLPGAWEGIVFLFRPEWSNLTEPRLWVEALTQNAWDTGAGWGLILAYATYVGLRQGTVKNAFATAIGNNVVSLLAAIMIFGTVFAIVGAELSRSEVLALMQESGPASTGLTFIWMPQLFGEMAFGKGVAILFFLGLSFAGLSSLVAMIELATRVLVDFGMRRKTALSLVAGVGYLLGFPSARNLNMLGNQDFVWGVALMISGAFIAFAVIRNHARTFRREVVLVNGATGERLGPWWDVVITWLIPLQVVVLLGWWMWLSASVYAPDDWFNPFSPYSVMTCLTQWGAALAVFLVLNRWLVKRTEQGG